MTPDGWMTPRGWEGLDWSECVDAPLIVWALAVAFAVLVIGAHWL